MAKRVTTVPEPPPQPLSVPHFLDNHGSHYYRWDAERIEVLVDRFIDSKEGVSAELTVADIHDPQSPRLLQTARLNLLSAPTRRQNANQLSDRMAGIDFDGLLLQVCRTSVEKHRAGDPAVDTRQIEPKGTRYVLYPFIEASGAHVIYAHGMSMKSFVATLMASAVASGESLIGDVRESGPVLYIDYEDEAETLAERAAAIATGHQLEERPAIYHRRQVAPLYESVDRIREEVRKLGAIMVVLDSLGMARGGEPESAEVTLRLFNAIRSLGVPALCIDHVNQSSKGKNGSTEDATMFGSVYGWNSARSCWSLQKTRRVGKGGDAVVLTHRKANKGHLTGKHAYEVQFQNSQDGVLEAVTFSAQELKAIPEFTTQRPLQDRILEVLSRGAQSGPQVAEQLPDAKADEVATRLSQLKSAGKIVYLPDRGYGLAARG